MAYGTNGAAPGLDANNNGKDEEANLLAENRKEGVRKRRRHRRKATDGTVLDQIFAVHDDDDDYGDGVANDENREGNDPRIGQRRHDHNHTHKTFIYEVLHPKSKRWQASVFKYFMTVVIVADLLIFIISTEPNISEGAQQFFHISEATTSSIFLVEYLARLYTVTESKRYRQYGPLKGRLIYLTTFAAVVDALATFPFFVEIFTGWDLPTLTYLRSLRLLRILKTTGFSRAIAATNRVIWYNRQILYVAFMVCLLLILFTSVLMYYLRPPDPDDAKDFQSIIATMYLSTLMLTGQGGPTGDMPWYTKAVVLLTGVFSIGMFAIPASMLTWGFEAEAERCAKLARMREKRAKIPKTSTDPDDLSCVSSLDDYSTDQEYQKIIAGAESDDESEDEDKKQFALADTDGSGTISLAEFINLSRKRQEEQMKQLGNKEGLGLSSRISELEKEVKENSRKLDEAVASLQSIQRLLENRS